MHNIVSLRLARNAHSRGCTCELYGVFQDSSVTQSATAIADGSSTKLGALTSRSVPLTQMSDGPCEARNPHAPHVGTAYA